MVKKLIGTQKGKIKTSEIISMKNKLYKIHVCVSKICISIRGIPTSCDGLRLL